MDGGDNPACPLVEAHKDQEYTTMSMITNDATLAQGRMVRRQRWIWWLAGGVGMVLLVGGIWFALLMRQMADENTAPPDLDISRTRLSAQRVYEGTYTPTLEPITIDKLHSWTLHLETPDGKP